MENEVMTNIEPMQETAAEQVQDASNNAIPVGQDGNASFSDFLADSTGSEESTPEEQTGYYEEQTAPVKEPGYVKKRLDKQAQQYNAQIEELTAKNTQMEEQIARLSEYYYQAQADELVKSGKIRDREMALAYVKSQAGIMPEQKAQQNRDENGRFTSREATEDASVAEQANKLYNQAMTVKNVTGVDVMELYNNDPAIQENVLSGKWDFEDVYRFAGRNNEENSLFTQKRTPSAVRSSNGVDVNSISVRRMSESEYRKLDDFLAKGGKVDMRR